MARPNNTIASPPLLRLRFWLAAATTISSHLPMLLLCFPNTASSFVATPLRASTTPTAFELSVAPDIPSWKDLSGATGCDNHEQPFCANGADFSSHPDLGNSRPVLYRERHGWCPYSERVWLALEAKGIDYDTIYIDNIYGRPSWYGGNTPQMKWEDGRVQSESMDLVKAIDERYASDCGLELYPSDIASEVVNKSERAFRNIFPKKARPSSRAAFLFRYDGTPLWKNEFEKTLKETDALLGENPKGPFFCGDRFTAADVCWAPFLERYAGQLPCLHEGLDPRCESTYPHLHRWYTAMEQMVPAYACRVRGDPSSWRKVLTMAGFGNAGAVPPLVSERMDELAEQERSPLSAAEKADQQRVWDEYAASRPFVASSPSAEAAAVLVRNREAIKRDVAKNFCDEDPSVASLYDEAGLDEAMRSLAVVLLCNDQEEEGRSLFFDGATVEACEEKCGGSLGSLAAFLDERMCVPRDMGALSAAHFKRIIA